MGYSTNRSAHYTRLVSVTSFFVSQIDKEILEKKRKNFEFKESSGSESDAVVG